MSFANFQTTCPGRRDSVILLHSSASSARQWQALIEVLQPRFSVHAVDLYGHGSQPAWQGAAPLTLADEAARVLPLLAQVGHAHVVGHSYGAAVALKLASMQPARVRSLVAYEPVMFRWLTDAEACRRTAREVVSVARAIRDRLARNQPYEAAQHFIDFWSGAGAWDSLPDARKAGIATRMHSIQRQFEALHTEPLSPAHLARLAMPMLFMTGAQTVAVTRRIGALVRHALPHARHEVLPALGHMGPITSAAQVNRRIVAFLHDPALARPVGAPSNASV